MRDIKMVIGTVEQRFPAMTERMDFTAKWHYRHRVLMTFTMQSIEDRNKFNKQNKPEWQIEIRERLLKPVRGTLPEAVVKAAAAFKEALIALHATGPYVDDAWEKSTTRRSILYNYYKAEDTAKETDEALSRVIAEHMTEIESLHAIECPDCPWDGNNIFPYVDSLDGRRPTTN